MAAGRPNKFKLTKNEISLQKRKYYEMNCTKWRTKKYQRLNQKISITNPKEQTISDTYKNIVKITIAKYKIVLFSNQVPVE